MRLFRERVAQDLKKILPVRYRVRDADGDNNVHIIGLAPADGEGTDSAPVQLKDVQKLGGFDKDERRLGSGGCLLIAELWNGNDFYEETGHLDACVGELRRSFFSGSHFHISQC